jgi:hypothetical protein
MKRALPTETVVAAQVDELAEAMGWEVQRYEQRRASMIHEGLPDRRYVHRAKGLRVWVELKRPGGKLTTEQHRWLLDELEAGALATVIEDVEQFAALCRTLGRGSSIMHSTAHDLCRAWVGLCWLRGPREGSVAARARGAIGARATKRGRERPRYGP